MAPVVVWHRVLAHITQDKHIHVIRPLEFHFSEPNLSKPGRKHTTLSKTNMNPYIFKTFISFHLRGKRYTCIWCLWKDLESRCFPIIDRRILWRLHSPHCRKNQLRNLYQGVCYIITQYDIYLLYYHPGDRYCYSITRVIHTVMLSPGWYILLSYHPGDTYCYIIMWLVHTVILSPGWYILLYYHPGDTYCYIITRVTHTVLLSPGCYVPAGVHMWTILQLSDGRAVLEGGGA